MSRKIAALGILSTLLAGATALPAATLPLSAGATAVFNAGSSSVDVTPETDYAADVGEYYSYGRSYIVPVLLPASLPAGSVFTSADLRFRDWGRFGNSTLDFNVDLYGLTRVAATDAVLATDHYAGPVDVGATMIQNDYITPASTPPEDHHTDTLGDSVLSVWLNVVWAGGANAGQYAFLRLSPDKADGTYSWTGYTVLTTLAGYEEERPMLSYTLVPEPGTMTLLALAGVAALRRRR